MFIEDFRHYLQDVDEITVEPQSITLRHVNSPDTIKISKYQDLIRLQVNGKGHVPLLIGVQRVEFTVEEDFLTIDVTFTCGIEKERTIFVQKTTK